MIVDVSPGIVIEGGNQVRDFLAGPESFASREEIVDRAASFGFGVSRASLERGVLHNTRVRDDGRVVFKHHLANLGDRDAPFSTDFRPLWPALEGAGVPVLLVRGSRGFLSDALVDELTSRVPDARAVTIDAGHNVQEDAPVELARVIADFVATVVWHGRSGRTNDRTYSCSDFTSRNSSKPCSPYSRPTPDCL